jgi:hypothetical protein
MDHWPDISDEREKVERRRKSRRPVSLRVWADPGGVKPVVDCKVINMSDDGARVAPVKGEELPDQFSMQVETARVVGEARVVWREPQSVGVEFADRKPG